MYKGVLLLLLAYIVISPISAFSQESKKSDYVPGEILVKFRSGTSRRVAQYTHRFYGGKAIRRFNRFNIDHIQVPKGWSVEEAISAYKLDPDVEYVEPNYIRRRFLTPDDPRFDNLWGLHNTGVTGGTEDADIDAPEAWDTQTECDTGVVAVLDTGMDLDHADLTDGVWQNLGEDWDAGSPGYDGVDNDGNGKIDDYYGWDFVGSDNDPNDENAPEYHGTHVSGIIGAKGNNGEGITGVCWAASLMPLRILDASGNGTIAREIEAINYAINSGARIISASFGGPDKSTPEYNAIKNARDAGILFVAAAGNDGSDNEASPVYPASHDLDNIISVAAVDYDDQLADMSNYGADSVDVAAPGIGIYSTKPGDNYHVLSGTSMAVGYVSGLASLVWTADDNLTYDQVKELILKGVDTKPGLEGKILTGGRINAQNSILKGPSPPDELVAIPVSSNQIDLTWADHSYGETGFKIERKMGAGGTFSEIDTVAADVTSYSDSGLSEAKTYYYRVRSYHSLGDSRYSSEAYATIDPSAPSDLAAASPSSSQIDLTWADNSSGESGFEIERKTGSNGTYGQVATVNANVTGYSDSGLKEATTYNYRVRAYTASGNSGFSAPADAATAPLAPTDLSVTVISAGQIDLSWTDNSSGESGFRIERKAASTQAQAGGSFEQIAEVGANVTSYADRSVDAESTYQYRIQAFKDSVSSPANSIYSAERSATTPTASTSLTGGGGGGGGCFIGTAMP